MVRCQAGLAGLLVLLGTSWTSAATRQTAPTKPPTAMPTPLPWVQRPDVRQVLDKPTLVANGPAETFTCRREHYQYFLDHPDRAVIAWRRLGAQCVAINERGDSRFSWSDEYGSEVVWETIHKSNTQRVWYAEGKVRPTPGLPLVPVRVVVVLNHQATDHPNGATMMQHQADVYLFTDSKTAALLTRLVGTSAHRIAQQGLGQLQLFFSGLSWYLHRNPDQAEKLLRVEN